jgi:hypothetical protein
MALFSKDEYLDWRNSPVHEAFLEEILEMINNELTYLSHNAGENSLNDRKRVGRIEGLKELADWEPTIEENLID